MALPPLVGGGGLGVLGGEIPPLQLGIMILGSFQTYLPPQPRGPPQGVKNTKSVTLTFVSVVIVSARPLDALQTW